MIYVIHNRVLNCEGKQCQRNTKVFAIDDEMALAVSRALCNTAGFKVINQVITECK